jgi:MFS family permease
MTTTTPDPKTNRPQSRLQAVLRVTSGNFLEMYDFMVFGFYATSIGRTFFPSSSAFVSLMLSWMTFGAAYLMRPLGAIVLGAYIDRHGRRQGLMLTLALMAVGILLIAAVPGYATIGLLAPLLVLAGRLLQGFSAGVELGGVSVYLAEIATPGHRGLYVSWQSASQQVAVVFAALLGAILSITLGTHKVDAWGWRIPFVIGCLIVPLLLFLRRSLQETEEFKTRTEHPDVHQIARSLRENWPLITLGTLMVVLTTVSFYFITAYTPNFGKTVLKLGGTPSLVVTLCVGLSNLLWLPVMGTLSDRIGRRPLLLIFSTAFLLTAGPALLWLTAAPSFGRLLGVELWLSFLYASYNGAMVVTLTEIMPRAVRASGFSLAYSLATALGGFTPAVCTALIQHTHNKAVPGLWLTFAAACGLTAVLLLTTRLKSAASPKEG